MRDQTREALLDFKTMGWCGTCLYPAGHKIADSTLKLEQKRGRLEVLVDQVNLPGVWPLTGPPAWRHISWIGHIVRRMLMKSTSWHRSPRKCILFLTPGKLDRAFVSALQSVGDVVKAVGDTDTMLDGPSMGRLSWLQVFDGDENAGSWVRPRNERGRRSAPLIEMPLPWLLIQPGRS
jgi:hypothetical protein